MKKKRFLKHVLLLDNYDSFTYNLKHYISSLGCDVTVVRNDEFDLNLSIFTHVILSPGPGLPENAGVLIEVIRIADGKLPVLGVCLGMQGIGQYLGGQLYNQSTVKHGVSESIRVEDSMLFKGIQSDFKVGLYHSWALSEEGDYQVTARTIAGTVMALENFSRKLFGVQFHPESIMTEKGKEILSNFLELK